MAYGDTLKTYTGRDAFFYFSSAGTGEDCTGTNMGVGDFSLTLDRGIVEQELAGEQGNYFTQGALSIEGSLTSIKLGADAAGIFLDSMINNVYLRISGGTHDISGVTFCFVSTQATGFDISIGDASTITEGSLDFTIMNPYDMVSTKTSNGNTHLSC